MAVDAELIGAMLEHVEALVCAQCQRSFRPSLRTHCPDCADGGQLRFRYALARLADFDRTVWAHREPWLWRYRELLPFDALVEPPPLQVGATPLYGSARLAAFAGVKALYIKDESRQPTGCIADRAAALVVAAGVEARCLASAELAESVAALAASAGQQTLALLRPDQDAAALLALGARVLRADPELDRREALLRLRAEGFYLADRPHPLVFEGLKTLGLELADQLAERMPDWVVVDAELPEALEAVGVAFEQLRDLGAYPTCPRLLAVDGEGGGDAVVRTDEGEREDAARAATRALGLPLEADGAAGLAGLRRAVSEGRVAADASAVVVVQGERARGLRRTFPEGEVMRSCETLIAAARLDPEGPSASETPHG